MATYGTQALGGWRNEACAIPITVPGLDLTGIAVRAQIRAEADNPVLTKDLPSGVGAGVTGILQLPVTHDGAGVPTSHLVFQVSKTDMQSLPYAGEMGDPWIGAYALQIAGVTRMTGAFAALASPIDSDGAPANRPVGWGGAAGGALVSGVNLTIGDAGVTLAIDGADLLASLVAQVEADRAAVENLVAETAVSLAAIATPAGLAALASARAAKLVDTSITSSTVLVPDPDLSVLMPANVMMAVRGRISYVTGAAGDVKWRHTGPGDVAGVQINRRAIAPGDGAFSGIGVDVAFSSSDISILGGTGAGAIEFDGIVHNGPTAGSFAIATAQNSSDATPTTLKAGSYLEYFLLPVQVSYAFAAAPLLKLGQFGTGNDGSHNFISALGAGGPPNSYIVFVATGTQCSAQVLGGDYHVTVDGGPPTTITAPAGWSFLDLFQGLPDAAHRVTISGTYLDADTTFRVRGSIPTISKATDLPANFYILGAAPFSTFGAIDAYSSRSPIGYTIDQYAWNYGAGFGLRFKATTAVVALWVYTGIDPGAIALLQDGVQIALISGVPSTGRYELVTLAHGLSGSHEYEVQFLSVGYSAYIWGLAVDSLDPVAHAARLLDVHYGDSIVAMIANTGAFDARQGDAYLIAHATGHAAIHLGFSGEQVPTYLRDHTAVIAGLPTAPSRIFLTAGTNDMGNGVNVATFQADYKTMLQNLRAGLPSAAIYARSILPRLNYTTGVGAVTRSNFNAAIAAAVSSLGDPNIHFVNTDGWIDPTNGVDTIEGLHPTAAGYAKIATAQLAVL